MPYRRMFPKVIIYIVAGGLYNPRPLVQPTWSPRVSHHRILQQQQVWMMVVIKDNKMRMVKDKW